MPHGREKSADSALAVEAHADRPPARKARDDRAANLYTHLVQLREMIVGAYGAQLAAELFTGSTPQDPVVLARFAGEVAARLDKAKLPAPRIKGAKLEPAVLADSLRDKRAALDKTFKSVQREVREAQATLTARDKTVAAYDTTFSSVAATLSGLLRHSGNPDLAARVRPSTRRPGQTAADADDATGPAEPVQPDET